jgi:two-component system sensor histidine kinase/response regulator
MRDSLLPAVKVVRGKQGVVEAVDHRGVRVLAAILPIPRTSWFLEAKIDEEEISEPLARRPGSSWPSPVRS